MRKGKNGGDKKGCEEGRNCGGVDLLCVDK